MDLCAAGGIVYASYYDGDTGKPLLTRLQQQGGRAEGVLRITGNGRLGAGREGRLLFQDGNDIYACVFQTKKAEKLLNLSAYDLVGEQLQAMGETSSGEIRLITWEMCAYDSPAWITALKAAEEGQMSEDGRRIITWLVVGVEVTDEEQAAAAFNRQSKDYKVVVEQVSLKGLTSAAGDTQYDLDTGIYMCVNTRPLARERRSALFSELSGYGALSREGVSGGSDTVYCAVGANKSGGVSGTGADMLLQRKCSLQYSAFFWN